MSRASAALLTGPAGPARVHIGPCVRYSKADAFEICGALALAESVLRAVGRETDAALVGAVFETAEAGLTREECQGRRGPAVGAPGQPRGSNSMARELTQ